MRDIRKYEVFKRADGLSGLLARVIGRSVKL